jgi:lipid II:glycine glycyltransferase (peptidoglycan interpeptide bridge formation enzyme)
VTQANFKKFMERDSWNSIACSFKNTSILQTWEWSEVKKTTGWAPDFYIHRDEQGMIKAASLILIQERRLTRLGPTLRIVYLPHGPLLDWSDEQLVRNVLFELIDYAKKHQASYIKIDPQAIPEDKSLSGFTQENIISHKSNQWMIETGWVFSTQQIQFKNSFWIDLTPSLDDLLAGMKQKTRYNIRLAERKGIEVHEGGMADLELLYEMYQETSIRDGFIIRPKEYYLDVWGTFIHSQMAVPLVASFQGEPVAALMLFHFAGKSYYLFGMSTDKHREKMPNYLLQWEAIKQSKHLGCEIYDLWGAPDVFEDSDRMWGVYRFKEGLGGKVVQTLGAYDYPSSRFTYTIIQRLLPLGQRVTRWMRNKQMREELEQV